MLESLSARLQETFRKMRGKGRLTEKDVDEALREVRLALLEADVQFKIVKDFISRIRERAVGQEVLRSLSPAQQVVKIVHDELTTLMGGAQSRLTTAGKPPTVYMLVGLQGSGKTTTAAKLALQLRKQGKQPLLVACDVYRPAAVDQLQALGKQLDVTVYAEPGVKDPVSIASRAVAGALPSGKDTVIVDTAGRLHIDDGLMQELERIKEKVRPQEILLVVDAMTGQDAVQVAEGFHGRLGIDGLILTKLDGDARGGAALSVRSATGCPIKFVGVGERPEALEPFHPERMASRILGMGDILSLVEKAQESFDREQAETLQRKIRNQEFNLEDFLEQMQQMKKLGPLDQILGMLPGMGAMKQLKNMQVDEKEMSHLEAIIRSMTPAERRRPDIINGSRRKRIAAGSGTRIQDVNRLLKQFQEVQKMMKMFAGGKGGGRGGGKMKIPKGMRLPGFP